MSCGKLQPPSPRGKLLLSSSDAPPSLPPPGPTVLEVFNTLLRQLRLSIDYALTGSYDCAAGVSTKIIKEHEERMFQEAVIKTIGEVSCRAWRRLRWWVIPCAVGFCLVPLQDYLG